VSSSTELSGDSDPSELRSLGFEIKEALFATLLSEISFAQGFDEVFDFSDIFVTLKKTVRFVVLYILFVF
jgi:hypothetical protein